MTAWGSDRLHVNNPAKQTLFTMRLETTVASQFKSARNFTFMPLMEGLVLSLRDDPTRFRCLTHHETRVCIEDFDEIIDILHDTCILNPDEYGRKVLELLFGILALYSSNLVAIQTTIKITSIETAVSDLVPLIEESLTSPSQIRKNLLQKVSSVSKYLCGTALSKLMNVKPVKKA